MTGILIYLHDNRCAISLGQSEVIEIKLCLLRILHMFSMDGDFAPLLELIKLHRMYGLLLVMDVPWTVGDHCDVGVIGLTKCSGTHGLLPCFDTFLLVSIQRETICVHPLDFMIWPQSCLPQFSHQ
ncbi:uncharacterized protein [Oryza sativa Japonica Group]